MAIYLGIDTSGTTLAIGLWSQDKHYDTLELHIERDHSKRILTELELFLNKNDVQKHGLKAVGGGLGPGAYTGIRVGIASAQGLAAGLNIPLRGCSSIEAMAHRCLSPEQTAVVAMDARRDNVYYGIFKKTSDGLEQVTDLARENRLELKKKHADLAYFEGIVPDASYLAKQASQVQQHSIEAIYL